MKQSTKLLLAFCLICCLPKYTFAGKPHNIQALIGGTKEDIGSSVIEMADGGFMVAGITNSYGAGGYDILVTRLDSMGRMIWAKTYGGSNDEGLVDFNITWNVDMILAPDSEFVICTNTKSFGAGQRDVYLLKINNKGTVTWANTYGGSDDDFGVSVANDPAGGFILTGETKSTGNGNGDILVIKTDDKGTMVWAKTYGNTNEETGYKIKPSNTGGFLICGVSNNGANEWDEVVMKISSSGSLAWSGVYGRIVYDLAHDIIELPDNSIYVACQSWISYPDGANQLMKFNGSGKLLWSKTWGNHCFKNLNYDAVGNTLYTSGFYRYNGVQYLSLLRSDTSGKPQQMNFIGKLVSSGGYSTGQGTSAILTRTGEFVYVGTAVNIGPGNHDLYFVKTDLVPKTNCNLYSNSVSASSFPVSNNFYTFNANAVNGFSTGHQVTDGAIVITDSIICRSFTADFNFSTVCQGKSQKFFFTDRSDKAILWSWDFGDSSSSSNHSSAQNPVHVYSAAGTYYVRLIAGNGIEKDTITKTVTIDQIYNDLPPKLIDICQTENLLLTSLHKGVSYRWQPDLTHEDTTLDTARLNAVKDTVISVRVANMNGCFITDTFKITVDTTLKLDLGPDRFFCAGSSVLLNTGVTDTSIIITWQDRSHLPVYSASKPGIYYARLQQGSCYAFDSVRLTQVDKPVAKIGNDTIICNFDSVYVTLTDLPLHTKIKWDDFDTSGTHIIPGTGKYYVTEKNECGVSSDTIHIYGRDCYCQMFVPNAFTPNPEKDSLNNIFIPKGCDIPVLRYNFMVFNRWGELIFRTEDKNEGWNGKYKGRYCPPDVYLYQIYFKDKYEVAKMLTGNVTLLR